MPDADPVDNADDDATRLVRRPPVDPDDATRLVSRDPAGADDTTRVVFRESVDADDRTVVRGDPPPALTNPPKVVPPTAPLVAGGRSAYIPSGVGEGANETYGIRDRAGVGEPPVVRNLAPGAAGRELPLPSRDIAADDRRRSRRRGLGTIAAIVGVSIVAVAALVTVAILLLGN